MEKLARKAREVEAVVMGMSSAYSSTACETLPHVDIVFDRYHAMALINHAIEDLRREQQRKLNRLGQ